MKDCVDSIRRHIGAIEAEREFRDRSLGTGPTLYESVDRPRIDRLRAAADKAARLEEDLSRAERLPVVVGLRPVFQLPETPVFDNVRPYHEFQVQMKRYLRSSLLFLDEGFEERIKSTSRLFEQWVFLQICTAFRAAGLGCEDFRGLMRAVSRQRFTLDLMRDTRLTFYVEDTVAIRVRYEPWILPVASARERRESVYRGHSGDTPWSPDILIEVLRGDREQRAEPPAVEYAVVIDAKYSKRIEERHWGRTEKYLQIRATQTGRQVVKQVWLAYPGPDGVECRDAAVTWTARGPDCLRDETIQGTLGLLPPTVAVADGTHDDGTVLTLAPTAVAFVNGLLAYLGLEQSGPDVRGRFAGSPSAGDVVTTANRARTDAYH